MITQEQKDTLVIEAKKALNNRYPKSDNSVIYSAAVLTKTGQIYSASNYSSETGSLTLHAEQSALAHAAAHGEGEIVAIAVTGTEDLKTGDFIPPCHMCKQLLWESRLNSNMPMLIILANNHDEVKEVDLDEMMPFPWPAKP